MNFHGTANLTRDPEVFTTRAGHDIVTFGIACNNGKDKDGKEKTAFFFDCKSIGFEADRAKLLRKGQRVLLTGEIQQETWDDKSTGAKRSKVVLLAWAIGVQADTRQAARPAAPVYDQPAPTAPSREDNPDNLPF